MSTSLLVRCLGFSGLPERRLPLRLYVLIATREPTVEKIRCRPMVPSNGTRVT